jgi:uncharacterized alpha/beta hydrolase family protein
VFSTLAPARRRLVLAVLAVLAVVVVALVAVVLSQRAGKSDRAAVDQNQPGPVLLVPGYGGSTGSLRTLARQTHPDRAGRDGHRPARRRDRRPQRGRDGSRHRGS